MEKLQLFLLILQVIIALIMIIVILIQRSDGDSLGGIGGGSGGLGAGISARASANALTKFTIFLAAFFMFNCLVLARISSTSTGESEYKIDKVIEGKPIKAPKNQKPTLPPIE